VKFQKIADGPSSYTTGGFTISVGQFQKIASAELMMAPETFPSYGLGLGLSYTGVTATVKVMRADSMAVWSEMPANTNLSGYKFILTGDAI